MSTPDRRLARGRSTRAQLLAAAIEVLREQGYVATSMRAVSERAGTPLSLVQYHFGSKQGLLVAVMDEMNARGLARQREMWADGRPFADQWRTACDFLHEDLGSGYVRIPWELWAAGLVDPELAARWREMVRSWRELIRERVVLWQAEENVELPMSALALATLIANAFWGAEAEILAGVSEDEAPHLEAMYACGDLIAAAGRRGAGGADLRVRAVASDLLVDVDGLLVAPPGGTRMTDDDVRALRDADQR